MVNTIKQLSQYNNFDLLNILNITLQAKFFLIETLECVLNMSDNIHFSIM